jgi:hypothetical protein
LNQNCAAITATSDTALHTAYRQAVLAPFSWRAECEATTLTRLFRALNKIITRAKLSYSVEQITVEESNALIMSYEPPPIIRPVPRRPFDINLTTATPPSDSDASTPSMRPSSPNHLDAKSGNSYPNGGSDTPNFNRTRSILNLTSSTLFGIYSPTFTERSTDNEPSTPFGTGAMTPLSPANSIAPTRPQTIRARSSQVAPATPLHLRIVGLTARSSLLFLLGTAYGLLVTHLHNEQRLAPFAAQGFIQPSYDRKYLIFWGVAGVAMGSALPWFDGMWEEYFGEEITSNAVTGKVVDAANNEEEGVAAQWTPVVRSIGAFFGIAFAIVCPRFP